MTQDESGENGRENDGRSAQHEIAEIRKRLDRSEKDYFLLHVIILLREIDIRI